MRRGVAGLAALLVLLSGRELRAQTAISAPGGVLTGTVQDSTTGLPVGYALLTLVGQNLRVFASDNGRFSLPGVRPGPATLRVQQIGYRGVTLPLVIDTAGPAAPGPAVRVILSRQPVILPEVIVRSEDCPAGDPAAGGEPESGTILDEVFRNAERLLTIQKDYPYRMSLRQVLTILDANRAPVTRRVDTIHYDSRTSTGYQRGKVLGVRRSMELGRPTLREYAVYFEPSDLAREEFRRHHCFWFAGRDSVEGFPGYRIDFRPSTRVTSPDWAGSLVIDSATMHLLRSEARLVNLPRSGTAFRSAKCTVFYMQLVPTLVHEFKASCTAAQNSRPPRYTVEQWSLVQRAFLGRRPGGAAAAPVPP